MKVQYYGLYEGILRNAIHLFKFNGLKRMSGPLGHLLTLLPLPAADGIVPVPMFRDGLLQRGFNQTAAIGKVLAERTGVPLVLDRLVKTRDTRLQTEVSGRERRKNLAGAFGVQGDVGGKRLILVDDVITTGATVAECSSVLKSNGALEVTVAALARVMPRG